MKLFLESMFFILPAYIANMAPIFLKFLPFGNFPVDHGRIWRGERLFGKHKTYRGLLAGLLGGICTTLILGSLSPGPGKLLIIPYAEFSLFKTMMLGALFGAGALLGDLIKSFFKRRIHIAEGKPWIPFDQLDFVIGAILAVSLWFTPSLGQLTVIVVITPLLHFLANAIGYGLGLKKVWW